MQKYLQKTPLGSVMDEIGLTIIMLAVSLCYFILLWGVRISSLAAGIAAFALCMILRVRTQERRLKRREMQLRKRIGGELKLEAWTVSPPKRAHFEAALLLSEMYPLSLERVLDEGIVCTLAEERLLIACAQMHREEKLTARDIAAFQRSCAAVQARRGVLCGAGATAHAEEQLSHAPEVVLISREEMIALAGASSPASDRDLVELGKRKRTEHRVQGIKNAVLAGKRAKGYLIYALLLLGMYLLSGQGIYRFSGVVCLILMALCRVRAYEKRKALL